MEDDRSLREGVWNAPAPEEPLNGLGARGEGITRAVRRTGSVRHRPLFLRYRCDLCDQLKARFCKGCGCCVRCCRIWELCCGA